MSLEKAKPPTQHLASDLGGVERQGCGLGNAVGDLIRDICLTYWRPQGVSESICGLTPSKLQHFKVLAHGEGAGPATSPDT